jgi:hypothetical protein
LKQEIGNVSIENLDLVEGTAILQLDSKEIKNKLLQTGKININGTVVGVGKVIRTEAILKFDDEWYRKYMV